jgi:hypothetical protein
MLRNWSLGRGTHFFASPERGWRLCLAIQAFKTDGGSWLIVYGSPAVVDQ